MNFFISLANTQECRENIGIGVWRNSGCILSHDHKIRKGDNIRVNHKLMFKDKIMREFVRLSAQLILFVKLVAIINIKFR